MKYKIVSDSAADILALEGVSFSSVPLRIVVGSREFVDDAQIDLEEMETVLAAHKGKSSTTCPGVGSWLEAFDDADEVFCVTLTSGISGSYNSALSAKRHYEERFPDRKVRIFDSLSAGPEMLLIVEKIQELILAGEAPDQVEQKVRDHMRHTRLLFSLETLTNFANNGRVNPAVAKAASILGVRIVGIASPEGELQVLSKCHGERRALASLVKNMEKEGYAGGKVRLAHNDNEQMADVLAERIRGEFPDADICIYRTRALCSYYAEKGGLLVGFEC